MCSALLEAWVFESLDICLASEVKCCTSKASERISWLILVWAERSRGLNQNNGKNWRTVESEAPKLFSGSFYGTNIETKIKSSENQAELALWFFDAQMKNIPFQFLLCCQEERWWASTRAAWLKNEVYFCKPTGGAPSFKVERRDLKFLTPLVDHLIGWEIQLSSTRVKTNGHDKGWWLDSRQGWMVLHFENNVITFFLGSGRSSLHGPGSSSESTPCPQSVSKLGGHTPYFFTPPPMGIQPWTTWSVAQWQTTGVSPQAHDVITY